MRVLKTHGWLVMILAGQLVLISMFAGSCAKGVQVQNPNAVAIEWKVAFALDNITLAVTDIRKQAQATLPPDQVADIVRVTLPVLRATLAAQNALKAIRANQTENPTPAQIVGTLTPLIGSISQSINNNLVGIKNPETKALAQRALFSVGVTLTAVKAVLEVTYGQ